MYTWASMSLLLKFDASSKWKTQTLRAESHEEVNETMESLKLSEVCDFFKMIKLVCVLVAAFSCFPVADCLESSTKPKFKSERFESWQIDRKFL